MFRRSKTGILIIMVLAAKCLFILIDAETSFADTPMRGGMCNYSVHWGDAKIASIHKTVTPASYGQPSYQSYDIKFSFTFCGAIMDGDFKIEEKLHSLRLKNSWYPGPMFLKKYGVEVGKVFKCKVSIISEGTCTPVLFEFPDINQADYSEFQSERR